MITRATDINDESIEGGALFKIFVPVEALIRVNKVGLNRSF